MYVHTAHMTHEHIVLSDNSEHIEIEREIEK